MAKLNKNKGKDNKTLPPITNNKAKIIDATNIETLVTLVSFLEDTLAINFNNK